MIRFIQDRLLNIPWLDGDIDAQYGPDFDFEGGVYQAEKVFHGRPLIAAGRHGSGTGISLARHFRRKFIGGKMACYGKSSGLSQERLFADFGICTARRFFDELTRADDNGTLNERIDRLSDTDFRWVYIDDFEALTVPLRLGSAFLEIMDRRLAHYSAFNCVTTTVLATSLPSVEFGRQFGKLADKVIACIAQFYPVNFNVPLPAKLTDGLPERFISEEQGLLEPTH